MDCIRYPDLKETIHTETLENGLRVYMLPKHNINKTYVVFSTHYGSNDNEFVPIFQKKRIKVPEGIAHFLEHKMFDQASGLDVFNEFARMGADANAYTSNGLTAYLFSTTNDVIEPLHLLLDYVQSPYFTEESVMKEQGIIEQELLMYLDDPGEQLHLGLVRNMFKKNEIRIDVGGTVRSIRKITKDLLYTCYETFYHPSNMMLFVVGNFDLEKIMDAIRDNQTKKNFVKAPPVQRKYHLEDAIVHTAHKEKKMSVVAPRLAIGVKYPPLSGSPEEIVKMDLAVSILMEEHFGKSSANYEHLLEKKWVNSSYSIASVVESHYGFFILKAETSHVEELSAFLKEKLVLLADSTMSAENFERHKRVIIGDFMRRLNSVEFIANTFVDYMIRGFDLFHVLPLLERLRLEDVLEARKLFNEESIATFVIRPKIVSKKRTVKNVKK